MLLLIAAALLLLIIGMKVDVRGQCDSLQKEQTTPIRGVCALFVILMHLINEKDGNSLFVQLSIGVGYLLVGTFLFYSGYGLMVSYKSKPGYRRTFIKHRIIPMLLSYLFFNLLYWVAEYLRNGKWYTVTEVISSLFNGSPIVFDSWFILALLYQYLAFYLLMWLFPQKQKRILLGSVCFSLIWSGVCILREFDAYWYNTSLCLPFGILIGIYKERYVDFTKKHYGACLAVSIFALGIALGGTVVLRALDGLKILLVAASCVLFITTILLVMMKCKTDNPIWYFLSDISLELYLFHRLSLRFFRGPHVYIENSLLYGLAVVTTSIPAAYLIHLLLSGKIRRMIRNIVEKRK